MREISQREYEKQSRDMDNIHKLSPLMRETLKWFGREGWIGCPGTRTTIEALQKRGLIERKKKTGYPTYRLTNSGRAVIR